MAAKKTRKPTKKTGAKAAKPSRGAKRPAAKPKRGAAVRAKARVKRVAAKTQARKAKPTRKAPAPKRRAPARKSARADAKPARKAKVARKAAPAKPARKAGKAAPSREKAAAKAELEKAARKAEPAPSREKRRPGKAEPAPSREKQRPAEVAKPLRKAEAQKPELKPGLRKSEPEIPKSKGSRREAPPEPRPSANKQRAPGDRRSSPGGKEPGKARASAPGRAEPRRAPAAPLREPPARLVSLPLPILTPIRRPSVEERAAVIDVRLVAASTDFKKRYEESLDMSWIYHDSALEGVVYTFEELRTALAGQAPPMADSSLQPTYDDIRRHKEAIEYVREYGLNKKLPVTIDVIRKIYLILHPEEGDIKTVKYRKDIPQHRLYFHEYAPPDKIAYKVRQIVDWLNDPETRKTRNGIRIAARAHYDLLRVYPFATDSGKVSRLFMNLLLIRSGLPPSIIHSTERQRYYEALKGSATTVLQMVQEAVENALSSVEKLLDEHETKKRAFVS